MPKKEPSFNKEYLSEKLLAIKEKLGDAYGGPLMEELIIRMERTVAHFDFEVETMLKKVTKRTNDSGAWEVHDNKRPPYNPHSNRLLINSSTTEATTNHVDFVSNGFKIRNTFSGMNQSNGDHYFYMAIGEFPFKYGRSR